MPRTPFTTALVLALLLLPTSARAQYPKLGVHGQGRSPDSLLARFDLVMETDMPTRVGDLKRLNPDLICLGWTNPYHEDPALIQDRDLRQWVVSTTPTQLTGPVSAADSLIKVRDPSLFFAPFYFAGDSIRQFLILGEEFPCQVAAVKQRDSTVTITRSLDYACAHQAGETVRGCASSWPGVATMNISRACPPGYWGGCTSWVDRFLLNVLNMLRDNRIDGVLIDQLGVKISDQLARAGYQFDLDWDGVAEDSATVDSLWRDGAWYILDQVHTYFPDRIVLTEHETWNFVSAQGRTFNGWPWLPVNGGVFGPPAGWILSMRSYQSWNDAAPYTLIHGGSSPADSTNFEYLRFTVASCLMGDGYCAFDAGPGMGLWWFDEYSVDTLTGKATGDASGKGWLGQALGPAFPVNEDSLVWRREFQRGTALVAFLPEGDSLWVDLGSTYRYIIGLRDTTHNTGEIVSGLWLHGQQDGHGQGEVLLCIQETGVLNRPVDDRCAPPLPHSCMALRISPNPARQRVTLRYNLPNPASNVSLRVYNLAGQLVRTFTGRRGDRGTHALEWDGTDSEGRQVSSGIYVARLQAGTQRQAARILLLREN